MDFTYLDDLLARDDFSQAADELATRTRDVYRLPPLHQPGVVVPVLERAAEDFENRGIGPFFIIAGRAVPWFSTGRTEEPGDQARPAVSSRHRNRAPGAWGGLRRGRNSS